MPRVKGGTVTRRRRKKFLNLQKDISVRNIVYIKLQINK